MGSYNALCNSDTGQCSCKPGITGRTCDACDIGFYGFSNEGCSGKRHIALLNCESQHVQYQGHYWIPLIYVACDFPLAASTMSDLKSLINNRAFSV